MTNVKSKLMSVIWLALIGAGCSEPFDPASLIDRTRVLGARIEVGGDPGRSTPRPGEPATVTWLVEAPGELPPLAWDFLVCPSASPTAQSCSTPPFAARQGTGQPRLELTVPSAEELNGARRLLVIGQISGTNTTLDLPLALDGEPNRNPTLAARPVWFADQPWEATVTGCDALPYVLAGTTGHVIRLQTLAEDREPFTEMRGQPPVPVATRERLQVSQFATAGEMEATYGFIEPTDERSPAELEVKWDAPKPEEVPPEGLEVRFTFVGRDLRGGVDWTHRSLCVTR